MKGETAFGYGSYQNMEMCYNKHPTSVAVLNGNVERVRTLVRTGCPVGIRIMAEGLNMVNKMLGQFSNRFKREKACAGIVPENLSEDQKLERK
jgi:hypothetical protein